MQITQPLHRALQQHPDKPALIFGSRRTTFRDMAARVGRLAGGLRELGMEQGDRVAILALNSDRYFEYLIGVPWGGGVINPCNTRWRVNEILYALEDSGSRILLVDDHFLPVAAQLQGAAGALRTVIHIGEKPTPEGMIGYEALIRDAVPVADAQRGGDDLFGLFYTGGTTGTPKGVMLSHLNFMCSSLALLGEGMASNGVFLHAAPMFHLADLAIGSVAWIAGDTHSFVPSFTVDGVIAAIERDQVTDTLLVPTMIQMLVDSPSIARADVSSIRTIVYGGSSISEAIIGRALDTLPDAKFFQAYGMTELSPIATVLPPFYHTAAGRGHGKLNSAGRAAYCTQVRVVGHDGQALPVGEKGEIAVHGPNVMLGYWNNPGLTSEAIRNGWMHTGDVGYFDEDGFLFVVDRVKDMIISGGENIYSAEVENALARHPAVQICAVIGVPNPKWGESVQGFVILKPGMEASAGELITHCKTLIAGYKCPGGIEFVTDLPLSGAGKILKTELRQRFVSRQPSINAVK